MSDCMHPLAARAASTPDSAAVRLSLAAASQRLSVRTGSDDAAAVGEALGVPLPITPCRTSGSADRVALWLGPDEWLIIADLNTELPETLPNASVLDVSHATTGIVVSSLGATWAINAFCALDLHLSVFPVGMCTRTLFGKAQIVLWRLGTDVFRIEAARSIAPYVWDLLEEARREFLS
jgi:sarcosine oxidase subunit gamma